MITLKDKDYWATPPEVVRGIERLTDLTFNLDACANAENKKCDQFISEEQDTLKTAWGKNKNVFVNPPYSNPLPFVEKAMKESYFNENNVVMLLNADCSTRWFRKCVDFASEIYFITDKRIAFLDYRTGKPIRGNNRPQMIVCFYHGKNPKWQNNVITQYISLVDLIAPIEEIK